MTTRITRGRPGSVSTAVGAAGLAIVVALLPVLGDGEVTLVEFVSAYVLVLIPVSALLYRLLLLAADLTVPNLLLLGAGAVGVASAYLGGCPENLI